MRNPQNQTATYIGPNDEPSEHDWLDVHKHVQGLTRFVTECHPPLTIAVQGGWGTGKTTILNMVRENLAQQNRSDAEAPTQVFVDVWQAAFASSSEDIIVGLVYAIADALVAESGAESEGVQSKAHDIKQLLRRWLPSRYATAGAALAGVSRAIEPTGALAHVVVQLLQEIEKKGERSEVRATQLPDGSLTQDTDQPVTGSDVRRCFHELMEKRYGPADTKGPARLVVFIDNLDRLNPQQAVEIMECLKAILDAPHCVFVVAVDFDVVAEGITLKYPSMGSEKARAFFDKIIQLPFHVPVGSYAMDQFVGEVFEQARGDAEIDTVTRIVDASVGPNPRSVKRIVNSYRLLTLINNTDAHDQLDLKLVALIGLQIAYPAVYQYLDTSDLSELATALAKISEEMSGTERPDVPESARMAAKALVEEAARRTAVGTKEKDHISELRQDLEIGRLAMLLTEMAQLYPTGGNLEESLHNTWRLASTTATEATTRRVRSEALTPEVVGERLADLRIGEEHKAWTRELVDTLNARADERGQKLRMTMQPGDRRLRLAFVGEPGGDVRLGTLYVQQRMKFELRDKAMVGALKEQMGDFDLFARRSGVWSLRYSEKYNFYILESTSPTGAQELAEMIDRVVARPVQIP